MGLWTQAALPLMTLGSLQDEGYTDHEGRHPPTRTQTKKAERDPG